MTHPPWMEASLEGPIPGCNRLHICGLFALFCPDLQSYPVDLVDVPLFPVQFETRHPPHISLHGSLAASLIERQTKRADVFKVMAGCSGLEALSFFTGKPTAIRGGLSHQSGCRADSR